MFVVTVAVADEGSVLEAAILADADLAIETAADCIVQSNSLSRR